MPVATRLPNHLRPKREKVFGQARGIPLDRNAKARIKFYVLGYNARMKQKGQHKGPITRGFMEVLEALLWGFHNSHSGLCFPSYEAIAEKAGCCRDTVYEAIKALEFANVLTWVNRIARERTRQRDLFGQWVTGWRIVRTSNAYVFRDPLPCHVPANIKDLPSKSENPSGTLNQDIFPLVAPPKIPDLDPQSPLGLALARLGNAIAEKIEREAAAAAA